MPNLKNYQNGKKNSPFPVWGRLIIVTTIHYPLPYIVTELDYSYPARNQVSQWSLQGGEHVIEFCQCNASENDVCFLLV